MNALMDEIQVTELRKLSKWREIDLFCWVYQYVCSCQVHHKHTASSETIQVI